MNNKSIQPQLNYITKKIDALELKLNSKAFKEIYVSSISYHCKINNDTIKIESHKLNYETDYNFAKIQTEQNKLKISLNKLKNHLPNITTLDETFIIIQQLDDLEQQLDCKISQIQNENIDKIKQVTNIHSDSIKELQEKVQKIENNQKSYKSSWFTSDTFLKGAVTLFACNYLYEQVNSYFQPTENKDKVIVFFPINNNN